MHKALCPCVFYKSLTFHLGLDVPWPGPMRTAGHSLPQPCLACVFFVVLLRMLQTDHLDLLPLLVAPG